MGTKRLLPKTTRLFRCSGTAWRTRALRQRSPTSSRAFDKIGSTMASAVKRGLLSLLPPRQVLSLKQTCQMSLMPSCRIGTPAECAVPGRWRSQTRDWATARAFLLRSGSRTPHLSPQMAISGLLVQAKMGSSVTTTGRAAGSRRSFVYQVRAHWCLHSSPPSDSHPRTRSLQTFRRQLPSRPQDWGEPEL